MLVLTNTDANNYGGIISFSSNIKVFLNGLPIAVVGADVTPYIKGGVPCKGVMTAKPTTKVFIGGLPVCITGDVDTCGSSFSALSNTKVFVL